MHTHQFNQIVKCRRRWKFPAAIRGMRRESIGKAGGYGIQGSASLFVQRVEGSLTNVIGLPLRELAEMLAET